MLANHALGKRLQITRVVANSLVKWIAKAFKFTVPKIYTVFKKTKSIYITLIYSIEGFNYFTWVISTFNQKIELNFKLSTHCLPETLHTDKKNEGNWNQTKASAAIQNRHSFNQQFHLVLISLGGSMCKCVPRSFMQLRR